MSGVQAINIENRPPFNEFKLAKGRFYDGFHIGPFGEKIRPSFEGASLARVAATNDENEGAEEGGGLEINEETFEWAALLEGVSKAGESFTTVDLGAGYGRWLVRGALAALQKGKKAFVVGVEAEKRHFAWLKQHAADNGLADQLLAVQAAVSGDKADVWFTEGHSAEWYGQAVIPAEDAAFGNWPEASVVRKTAITIAEVLAQIPIVDMLHCDIQGAELEAFIPAMEAVSSRVKSVHIGTHRPDIDTELTNLFQSSGWEPRYIFPCNSPSHPTEFGPVSFQDGVQSWRNPRL